MFAKLPSRLEVKPLTKEQYDVTWAAVSGPATVEDYKWWVGERPQMGGFITRSTIEDLPPNPLYMELFE